LILAIIRLKGKLEIWDDDKGYGFIAPEKSTENIFVHIFAFGKDISRRPKIGDIIHYTVHTDNRGKTKAVDAIIEGGPRRKKTSTSRPKKYYRKRESKSSWRIFIICLILLLGISSSIYNRLQSGAVWLLSSDTLLSYSFKASPKTQLPASGYSCEGKTHCSHMTSCEEAQFYLRKCPGTEMDGDGDGIPCESQWCD
jgi:cold shock CspA family protein